MPLRYFFSANFACILFTSSIATLALIGIPVCFYLAGLDFWSIVYTLLAAPCAFLLLREDWYDYCRDRETFNNSSQIRYF